MFIYKTAKFAPAWTTILKIRAIVVHQPLTGHAHYYPPPPPSPQLLPIHGRGGQSSCLVYCSTPIGLNLANFEIFTEGLLHTAEKISIFDTTI